MLPLHVHHSKCEDIVKKQKTKKIFFKMLISHLSIHIHTQKWKIILLLDGNKKMFVTHEKYHNLCIILHPPIKQILTYNMVGLCFQQTNCSCHIILDK